MLKDYRVEMDALNIHIGQQKRSSLPVCIPCGQVHSGPVQAGGTRPQNGLQPHSPHPQETTYSLITH